MKRTFSSSPSLAPPDGVVHVLKAREVFTGVVLGAQTSCLQ
jgi:hypothetical protein